MVDSLALLGRTVRTWWPSLWHSPEPKPSDSWFPVLTALTAGSLLIDELNERFYSSCYLDAILKRFERMIIWSLAGREVPERSHPCCSVLSLTWILHFDTLRFLLTVGTLCSGFQTYLQHCGILTPVAPLSSPTPAFAEAHGVRALWGHPLPARSSTKAFCPGYFHSFS